MPIRKTEQEIKTPDALTIDRASFSAALKERVELGKRILEVRIINDQEFKKNEEDYNRWNSYNSEFLKHNFNNEQNEYKIRYDKTNSGGWVAVYDYDFRKEVDILKDKIRNKVRSLEMLIDTVPLLKSELEVKKVPSTTNALNADNKKVFIVHGHNEEIREKVARTIEKLRLKPIILSEQANAGKTVLEKFEANSEVGFAIILLTDDDLGKSKTEADLHKRARQNVILELGYFFGKLGRSRVMALYTEGVELPSDINGFAHTSIDKDGMWKFRLVTELQAANYNVDANELTR